MKKIRVAIVGVGSCASALIQGIDFYNKNPGFKHGLTYEEIGGYKSSDIEFVCGFDVDARKVGRPLSEAIYAKPNCNMRHVDSVDNCSADAIVYRGPTLDGIAPHMRTLPDEITFVESDSLEINDSEYRSILKDRQVDVLLNYVPVGSREAAAFYINNAVQAGVHIVNCMPTFISTDDAMNLESSAIESGAVIVGSDMRSAFGASRLSEVLQGSMLDSGLTVTQHVQMNTCIGTTQGDEHIIMGRSMNGDFTNMASKDRLYDKWVSKENVLRGQNEVRDAKVAGMTYFAGPSLSVTQKPGGTYVGSDNKVANLDIVAYGWAGARYELTARLSVQDSPNSGGIVFDALRFCKVAAEEGVVGYLRGISAWTQKSPPVQMKTADAKFECDALSRRVITPMVSKQLKVNSPKPQDLDWSFQKSLSDYE